MNRTILSQTYKYLAHVKTNSFSTSTTCHLIQKYRKEQGLPMNPNVYGPLTDLPDYTYLDGRPTPLGMNKKKRIVKQRAIAEKILTLSKEMDFAKERYANKLKEEEDTRKNILANKLKPKGHLLLKDKK